MTAKCPASLGKCLSFPFIPTTQILYSLHPRKSSHNVFHVYLVFEWLCMYFYLHKYYLCNICLFLFSCEMYPGCGIHIKPRVPNCCIIFLGVHYILLTHLLSDDIQSLPIYCLPKQCYNTCLLMYL